LSAFLKSCVSEADYRVHLASAQLCELVSVLSSGIARDALTFMLLSFQLSEHTEEVVMSSSDITPLNHKYQGALQTEDLVIQI